MKNYQKGVGLIEVLVALVLLAVGILGFSLLQLRAMDAAQEATERTEAMNLARDLAERMRLNKNGLEQYKTEVNKGTATSSKDCLAGANASYLPSCTATDLATYDVAEVMTKAKSNGQTIVMNTCVSSKTLNCIYVSWGTTVIKSDDLTQCVNSTTGVYLPNSKCLVMEAF